MRILGIDIGGTSMNFSIVDREGNLSEFKSFKTEGEKGGPHIVKKLFEKIKEYNDYEAICISTAGQVDSEEGSIIYANDNIPNYTGTRLKEILEDEFQKPVYVENDVNAAALGELYFGSAEGLDNFLCLTYGTGIGGAIVEDGEIYRGSTGSAGEFGHMMIYYDKENKSYSYYEKYASTRALVNKAREISDSYSDGKLIFKEFNNDNKVIVELVEDWVFDISLGLVSLIHIFNPSNIVIGGGIMEQDILVDMIDKNVKSMIMDSFKRISIKKAALGNNAAILGAVSLYLRDK